MIERQIRENVIRGHDALLCEINKSFIEVSEGKKEGFMRG